MTIQEKIEVLEAARDGKLIAAAFRKDMKNHSLLKGIESNAGFTFGEILILENKGSDFNFGIYDYIVLKEGTIIYHEDEDDCETVFENQPMSSVGEFYSSFIYSNVVSKEQFLNAVLSEDPSDNVAIIAARKFINAGGILLND